MITNDIKNELSTNFIEYAVACNTDRAIPDAKSGLKPVARRILWDAYTEGYTSNKPHVKSAKVVGSVLARLHPHGDSSVYDAMIRLSQNWVMRYPLIDIHGNNGNISGDGAASSRYSEARLTRIAEDGLLAGLKKRNVDFMPNYSEDEEEPVTLPAIFPNLLCNPNSGIGVALATSFLPHNLKEVAQAINDYLDGKEPMLEGPDFPTGGLVINKNDIPAIMRTGHGSVKVRGQYKIEQEHNIVFYEIPYGQTIEGLLDEISEVCNKKEIEGILEIRDESNKKGLRIVIQCNKEANPEQIIQQLFTKTNLQTSLSYNQVALINKTPTLLNLKQCIEIYVNHNLDCLRREATFDITKAQNRLNIVKGLLIALEDIDNIITKIKTSENAAAAKNRLMNDYNMNELQAKAVLDMKLSKLAKLEKVEVQKEQEELISTIENLNNFLTHKEYQVEELKERLNILVQKYGDDRRTELTQVDTKKEKKEKVIISKDCVVLIIQDNMIKRVDKINYKPKKRKTKGIKNNGEIIKQSINTHTLDTLTIFSSLGKIYKIAVNDIPEQNTNIFDLIKFAQDDVPVAYVSLNEDSNKPYIIFATRNGIIKKTLLSEFEAVVRNRTTAIALYDGDILVDATLVDKEPILIITKKGYISMINNAEFAIMTRTAKGTRGIALTADDYVMRVLSVPPKMCYAVLITENNKGKKISISDFNPQKKGGKGTPCSKELLAGAAIIEEFDPILVCGETSSLVLDGDEFPTTTRTSPGVMITKNNMKILSLNAI